MNPKLEPEEAFPYRPPSDKILLKYNLQKPYLDGLESSSCDSSDNIQVRWAELQMNNNFILGEDLPIPNTFSNAAKALRMLSNIKLDSKENELLKALQEISFERNSILIESLVDNGWALLTLRKNPLEL